MVFKIISIFIIMVFIAIIINQVEKYYKKKESLISMSFKESLDLTELPLITFYNNRKKLNFLLDTGSTSSIINESVLSSINYKLLDDTSNVIGIEGNPAIVKNCEITINYKKQPFTSDFIINNMDVAFSSVKKEFGVQLHGILGNNFFKKYQYVIDFDSFIAYTKIKNK